MKGKKYSTEDKIRILRQAGGGRSILEVCREANISEVTFHRWKNQFGQMEVSEAKRLKELERGNTELKKMLAESPLKNRVLRKKVISPEQRRRAARALVASELCSGRAACRFLKVSRSTYWYRSKEPTSQEQRLLKRMRELSEKHGRYGYRRIAALLRQEGWPVGKRHVQRLRRSLGLRVPPTRRKVVRRGVSTGLPTKAEHRGHVWSWDFISDATTRGGALRLLTILDEYTR